MSNDDNKKNNDNAANPISKGSVVLGCRTIVESHNNKGKISTYSKEKNKLSK